MEMDLCGILCLYIGFDGNTAKDTCMKIKEGLVLSVVWPLLSFGHTKEVGSKE